MPDNLFKRARAFIGLDDRDNGNKAEVEQKMDMNAILRNRKSKANGDHGEYEVIIYEPGVYEDSLGISSQLRAGNPVIVNLKNLEPEEGTRLIDFVCGTAYAIDGHMIKIGESIFLFTPKQILITDMKGSDEGLRSEAAVQDKAEAFFEGS